MGLYRHGILNELSHSTYEHKSFTQFEIAADATIVSDKHHSLELVQQSNKQDEQLYCGFDIIKILMNNCIFLGEYLETPELNLCLHIWACMNGLT